MQIIKDVFDGFLLKPLITEEESTRPMPKQNLSGCINK